MKLFFLMALWGLVFCYPYNLYKDAVSFYRQNPDYFFFSRDKNIFNNLDIKNRFINLFFLKEDLKKIENIHICLLRNEILDKNKEKLFVQNERLESAFEKYCNQTSDEVRFVVHDYWQAFLYKTNDGKKICKDRNACAILIEDDNQKMILGWDNYGIEIFEKSEKMYKLLNATYDLSQKNAQLNAENLNSFVEIAIPSGGIGNNLFSYWTGVVYALKNNKKPLFYGRSYIEDYFILPYKTTEKVKFNYGGKPEYIKKYINNFTGNGSSSHTVNSKGNFVYINGYVQSWRNMVGYEDYIRENVVFKNVMTEKNREIVKKMQQENSVSLHVRRGDYVWQGYVLLTNDYYDKAIEYMLANVDNPHFYIFSNDMNWVKENIKLNVPHTFVDWNKKDYEDLELMSHCKNHIIANSTFSWWGAFLSKNKNKIVIAPDKHSSFSPDWIKPLLSPEFVVVPVKKYYYDSGKKEFVGPKEW